MPSNDTTCGVCTVSSTKPTCTGEDGVCVCPSLCEVVLSASSDGCHGSSGDGTQGTSMMYVAVALGALCVMLLLYLQRKCAETRARRAMGVVRRELEARRQQRRREREMLRERRPELALELTAWRDHVEMHKPQMSKIELETCYYLMMQDEKKDGATADKLWDTVSAFFEDETKPSAIGAVSSPLPDGVAAPPSSSQGESHDHDVPMAPTPYAAVGDSSPDQAVAAGLEGGRDVEAGSAAQEVAADVELGRVNQPTVIR
ncbi:hypothetical protein BBJ28_00004373 [Nothophytophthora sp. Chile5]|nr:hypothetical protein BBJ28_00004373 [Nothophytophthora sp. Chile5]